MADEPRQEFPWWRCFGCFRIKPGTPHFRIMVAMVVLAALTLLLAVHWAGIERGRREKKVADAVALGAQWEQIATGWSRVVTYDEVNGKKIFNPKNIRAAMAKGDPQ